FRRAARVGSRVEARLDDECGRLPLITCERSQRMPDPVATVVSGARGWPVPPRPWLLRMVWEDLLFAHWPCDPAALEPHLPPGLALDTFDGRAWLGVVPFRISGIRARGLPAIPGLRGFLELNLRTYVVAGGKPGVWFFSLDAASRA